ncbi:hypothetical protein P153DRAFT_401827 [Dothidotthia symphoricarpi CBS 119687]|uniref:Uncharacterized protein n=1 Tax=Dothidotthia symphoricarpi CBS 119687 TaxID=1392245 RepID=A0A6A5ZV42_9PLEO|nr:uncharacterized protein P153DRAFT_401827 [Dothidotthia symphoricarpi CBS 119687]KAF2123582.1 hypothetical protein P153DRAFT_401827 [Dothidotthia symphoricarpi CBS 119687]
MPIPERWHMTPTPWYQRYAKAFFSLLLAVILSLALERQARPYAVPDIDHTLAGLPLSFTAPRVTAIPLNVLDEQLGSHVQNLIASAASVHDFATETSWRKVSDKDFTVQVPNTDCELLVSESAKNIALVRAVDAAVATFLNRNTHYQLRAVSETLNDCERSVTAAMYPPSRPVWSSKRPLVQHGETALARCYKTLYSLVRSVDAAPARVFEAAEALLAHSKTSMHVANHGIFDRPYPCPDTRVHNVCKLADVAIEKKEAFRDFARNLSKIEDTSMELEKMMTQYISMWQHPLDYLSAQMWGQEHHIAGQYRDDDPHRWTHEVLPPREAVRRLQYIFAASVQMK